MLNEKAILFFIFSVLAVLLFPFIGKGNLSFPLKAQNDFQKVNLTLYSERNTDLLEPVLKAYKKENPHVSFHIHTDKAPSLIEKLKNERPEADLLITVDAGYLDFAKKQGLLKAQKDISSLVGDYVKDRESHWCGVSLRARTIFYNPKKISSEEIVGYENLGSPKFKNRLCLRTSKKVYNQSLVAFFILLWGEEKTKRVLKNWVNNLATKVFTSDTLLLKAISSGQCDVGIANSYYYGRLLRENPKLSEKLRAFWPQDKVGVHVNISGVGILKNSQNENEIKRFVKWLFSAKAQEIFAHSNLEYPIAMKKHKHSLLDSFSKGMKINKSFHLQDVTQHQLRALRLIYEVGYE